MAHYKGSASEGNRAANLIKKREKQREELERMKQKIAEVCIKTSNTTICPQLLPGYSEMNSYLTSRSTPPCQGLHQWTTSLLPALMLWRNNFAQVPLVGRHHFVYGHTYFEPILPQPIGLHHSVFGGCQHIIVQQHERIIVLPSSNQSRLDLSLCIGYKVASFPASPCAPCFCIASDGKLGGPGNEARYNIMAYETDFLGERNL